MPMLESVLTALMKMTAPPGYPVSLEKLDIDDNNALWTDYTPDYQPAAPLKEDRFADLVIIGGGFHRGFDCLSFQRTLSRKTDYPAGSSNAGKWSQCTQRRHDAESYQRDRTP